MPACPLGNRADGVTSGPGEHARVAVCGKRDRCRRWLPVRVHGRRRVAASLIVGVAASVVDVGRGQRRGRDAHAPYDQRCWVTDVELKLGVPFGTVAAVVGRPLPARQGSPLSRPFLVQRINGQATQKGIVLDLRASRFLLRVEQDGRAKPATALDEALTEGSTFALRGFEVVESLGTPAAAVERPGAWAKGGLGFRLRRLFVVYAYRRVPPVRLVPALFVGRRACFEATAVSSKGKPAISGKDWVLSAEGLREWPEQARGRLVELRGVILRGGEDGEFVCRDAKWRLVRLADMVGQEVELEGIALREAGSWRFIYRGLDVHVEGMDRLPGLSDVFDEERVVVGGRLAREDGEQRPRQEGSPVPEQQYVVKDARWRPAPESVWPGRRSIKH